MVCRWSSDGWPAERNAEKLAGQWSDPVRSARLGRCPSATLPSAWFWPVSDAGDGARSSAMLRVRLRSPAGGSLRARKRRVARSLWRSGLKRYGATPQRFWRVPAPFRRAGPVPPVLPDGWVRSLQINSLSIFSRRVATLTCEGKKTLDLGRGNH